MPAENLKKLQVLDETLAKIREVVDDLVSTGGIGFFRKDRLIYRKGRPRHCGDETEVEQFVLPKEC